MSELVLSTRKRKCQICGRSAGYYSHKKRRFRGNDCHDTCQSCWRGMINSLVTEQRSRDNDRFELRPLTAEEVRWVLGRQART